MPNKLLFLQNLIDFDPDWNSNHRLLGSVTELTPGSNIDAVSFLSIAHREADLFEIAFWVRYVGIWNVLIAIQKNSKIRLYQR